MKPNPPYLIHVVAYPNIFVTSSDNVFLRFFVTVRSPLYNPFSTTANVSRLKIYICAFPIPGNSVMFQPNSS